VCFASTKVGADGKGLGEEGAEKTGAGFRWRREPALLAAAVLGAAISFLGSFFYYGSLHDAATKVSQPALELLQYDPRLNHIDFNARLLKIWAGGKMGRADRPEYWPAHFNWWFEKPPDGLQEKTADLREFARPFPLLARSYEGSSYISEARYRA